MWGALCWLVSRKSRPRGWNRLRVSRNESQLSGNTREMNPMFYKAVYLIRTRGRRQFGQNGREERRRDEDGRVDDSSSVTGIYLACQNKSCSESSKRYSSFERPKVFHSSGIRELAQTEVREIPLDDLFGFLRTVLASLLWSEIFFISFLRRLDFHQSDSSILD